MTKTIDAVYSRGILRPLAPLHLAEEQRVRITIETDETEQATRRREAWARFCARVDEMDIRLDGPLPTDDELHDRV